MKTIEADHVGDDDDEHSHQVEKLDAALEFAVIGVASPFEGTATQNNAMMALCFWTLWQPSGPTACKF